MEKIVDKLTQERVAFIGGPNADVLEAFNYMTSAMRCLNEFERGIQTPSLRRDLKTTKRIFKSAMNATANLFDEAKKHM